MRAAITDANIFIDLFKLGLLEKLPFIEPFELETTLLVISELNAEQQLATMNLVNAGQIALVEPLVDKDFWEETASVFSEADRSVMSWALQNGSMVLSGDQPVVRFCRKKGLEAHGVLWVIEQFFVQKILDLPTVLEKLDALEKANRWISRTLIDEKRRSISLMD